ncbi:MAG: zinc ribbon domain-containing protein [Planctomycetota bacterium]
MTRQIDPGHAGTRSVLKTVGPLMILVGAIFAIIGMVSFFSSFNRAGRDFGSPPLSSDSPFDSVRSTERSSGMPQYFWCAFIGLPMVGFGIMVTKYAYMGRVARYVAGEVAPVAKDTLNYMADGVKESVRELAGAVGEGMRSGGGEPQQLVRCNKCNATNDVDANFCNDCGAALSKTKTCPGCSELNDPDARFCDNCGKPLA